MNSNYDPSTFNEDIQKLREETARPAAKGDLILNLQRGSEARRPSLIRKLSIPTALTAVAVIGFMAMRPQAMASPASVVKAIQQAASYTIRSFVINGSERTLQSEARVENGKKTVKLFGPGGVELPEQVMPDLENIQSMADHIGIQFGSSGGVRKLNKEELEKIRARFNLKLGGKIVETNEARMVIGKSGEGKGKVRFYVNGKEVKELPKEMNGKIEMDGDKGGVFLRLGDVKKGEIPKELLDSLKEGKGKIKMGAQRTMTMMSDGKTGKMSVMMSGQTSAEYLLKLLQDESKWNIERGVELNGQKLDRFTFKGSMSPVELYVDPSTSLPKVLRFNTVLMSGVTIEDVYEYGPQPTRI